MELKIESTISLLDIRNAIKEKYPYLDIAFFSEKHNTGGANASAEKLPYYLTVGSATRNETDAILEVHSGMKVQEIESAFETTFGLHAQILRKSGEIYLQTTTTDGLTLAELNQKAESDNTFVAEKEEPGDYHEQE